MSDKPDLFEKLGGTRKMAEILGEPPSTVQSWKTAGRVPAAKQPDLITRAAAAGITVTAEEVVWPFGKPEIEPALDAA